MILFGLPVALPTLVLAAGILLLAGIVKGTLGFGVGLVSATLLIQLFPAKLVLVVLVLPIGLSEAGLLVTTGVPWGLIREYASFFAFLVPGAVAGVLGLLAVPVDVLYLLLSGYIVVFLATQRYGSRANQLVNRRGFGPVSGAAGGVLGGSFGAAGPAVVPYLYSSSRNHPRSAFVGGMAAAYIVPQIIRLPLFIVADRFGPQRLALGGLAAAIVLTGLGLGSWLRQYVPEGIFQLFVKGVLLLMAAQLASDAFV
jgi:uncharacterized membrane protein YfcA